MLLKELFEGGSKHVTFCFGRMNPPTIGHEQVFKTMEAQGGDYFIFVSQSQDKKENPLSYSEKIKFIKAIHEKYADHVLEDSNINTVVKAASYLYDQGYTDATFVAGSDRIEQFKKLLTQYNGVEGKAHGYYKFNILDFVSSGEREDGAEGVAGVSASGARLAAANNDLEAFTKATGAGQYAKPMFDAVRQGMGIKETIDQISELAGEEDYYKFIVAKLKLGRPLTKREQEFLKTYRLMHKTEGIDMRAAEILEHKKSRRAKTYNVKPRNPVAHAAQTTISGSGAHKDKKKAEKQGYEKHKGRSVEEASDDLRDALLSVLQTIYNGAVSGEDMIDTLADEFNQYYDDVEQSGDETLQQAYHHMMDNGQEAEDEPMLMAKIAKEAIAIINQEEGSVMEYETHRYTDDQGNEWEVNDEGDKTLIKRGWGGGSSRRSYNRPKPAYNKPKGYYFYNVPAGKENDARTAGLRQSKSGKWFDTMTNFNAEKIFGKGRYWEPKN